MKSTAVKSTLFKLHRWVGVGLAPLFLVIALSGAVLALKPMQPTPAGLPVSTVSGQQLMDLLGSIDPRGETVQAIQVDSSSGLVEIRSQDPQTAGLYDPRNATRSLPASTDSSFDLFEFAEHLHKELLIGADILVQIASYLMLAIAVTAPFLTWPRLRNNLRGWHQGVGWVLLPLVLMLPLTGVLMSLHIGMPELPQMSQPGTRLSLQQALDSAQQHEDLNDLRMLRHFRGGSVLMKLGEAQNERLLVVTDHSVSPIDPNSGLVKALHEGAWAGPWSGALNLVGALALCLLTLTGSLAWLRRRRKRAHLQARRAAAEAAA